MLEWVLIFVAMVAGGAPGDKAPSVAQSQGAANTAKLEAEPQEPTGKFTAATEVRPILEATRANWVALREYDGQDLLYVTHLFSWRCGLVGMRYAVNGGAMVDWPLPPCLTETATPNAIRPEDGLPYIAFALGSVQSVEIEITYDDLSTDSASYERAAVLMP